MIRQICLVVLVTLFASTSRGDLITIGTDAPLSMDPGTTSGQMYITVTNNLAVDQPADWFEGWQANLQIIPDAGATGSITFNSPSTGPAPQPANYVFASTTSFGISATNGGSTLSAFDFEFPTGPGVQVPLAPGLNLLQVDFLASADAFGTFGVYALGGPAQSEWTAADLTARNFINVPSGLGGMVQIGTVFVVPEPSSAVLMAIGLLGGVFFVRCRQRR